MPASHPFRAVQCRKARRFYDVANLPGVALPTIPGEPGAEVRVFALNWPSFWSRGNRPHVLRPVSLRGEDTSAATAGVPLYVCVVRPGREAEDAAAIGARLIEQGGPLTSAPCDLFRDGSLIVQIVAIAKKAETHQEGSAA